jgi:quercetin 2,3-dioxygenase
VLGATVKAGDSVEYALGGRKGYLVPATGKVEIEGEVVNTRDGAALADLATLRVTALEDAELVLVDTK